jgi:hypothetical protein
MRVPDVLGEPDQFQNDFGGGDGVRVVASDRVLQPVGEGAGLDDIRLALRPDLAVDEFPKRLQSEVLLLHALNLGEKLIRQDRDVGRVDPRRLQDVDDLR